MATHSLWFAEFRRPATANRRSPYDVTSRDPASLVDLRSGIDAGKWSLMAWSKNLTNKIYNAEFSTGGFLWKAQPRTYGVDYTYHF